MHKSPSTRSLTAIKLLFATGSLALTIILWNLFATRALADATGVQDNNSASPDNSNQSLSQLAPMPTLIPLEFNLASADSPVQAASTENNLPGVQPTQALRKVSVPTSPAAVQKPVIREVTIEQPGSGGGGGGGGAPAANTGSSK